MLKRRHSGQANPVLYLPIGFARIVIADADDILRAVLLPELRCAWIHRLREIGVVSGSSMAGGTLLRVDLRAGLVHLLIRGKGWLLHLVQDAGIERKTNNLSFKRKRLVRGCDRERAKLQVSPDATQNHQHSHHDTE